MEIYQLFKVQKVPVYPTMVEGTEEVDTSMFEMYCHYCKTVHTFSAEQIGKIQVPICKKYQGFNPYHISRILPMPQSGLYRPEIKETAPKDVSKLTKKRDGFVRRFDKGGIYKYMYFPTALEAVPTKYLKDWERLLRSEEPINWRYAIDNMLLYGQYEKFFVKLHDCTQAKQTGDFWNNIVPFKPTEDFMKEAQKMYMKGRL